MHFILRWLATAIAVAVAVWLVPGIEVFGAGEAWMAIALFALVLALVNMLVKPIVKVLSLPVTILTLGLFYLVINVAMLYLAAWLAAELFGVGLFIASFGSAFVASIVVSIVAGIVNGVLGNN